MEKIVPVPSTQNPPSEDFLISEDMIRRAFATLMMVKLDVMKICDHLMACGLVEVYTYEKFHEFCKQGRVAHAEDRLLVRLDDYMLTLKRDLLLFLMDKPIHWSVFSVGIQYFSGISAAYYDEAVAEGCDLVFTCNACRHEPMDTDDIEVADHSHQIPPLLESTRLSSAIEDNNTSLTFDLPKRHRSFLNELAEPSIMETTVAVLPEEALVTYQVIEKGTKRGNQKLVSSDGYCYVINRRLKGSVDWRCSVRNKTTKCSATVKQMGHSFQRSQSSHSHPARPGIHLAVQKKSTVKVRSKADLFETAPVIVYDVNTNMDGAVLPEASRQSTQAMYMTDSRARTRIRPYDPQDLDFVVPTKRSFGMENNVPGPSTQNPPPQVPLNRSFGMENNVPGPSTQNPPPQVPLNRSFGMENNVPGPSTQNPPPEDFTLSEDMIRKAFAKLMEEKLDVMKICDHLLAGGIMEVYRYEEFHEFLKQIQTAQYTDNIIALDLDEYMVTSRRDLLLFLMRNPIPWSMFSVAIGELKAARIKQSYFPGKQVSPKRSLGMENNVPGPSTQNPPPEDFTVSEDMIRKAFVKLTEEELNVMKLCDHLLAGGFMGVYRYEKFHECYKQGQTTPFKDYVIESDSDDSDEFMLTLKRDLVLILMREYMLTLKRDLLLFLMRNPIPWSVFSVAIGEWGAADIKQLLYQS